MITNQGRSVIQQYFAGQIPQVAGSMAFGVGTVDAAATDTFLTYEVVRKGISSINADLDNNRIVFKSDLLPGQIKKVYEIGLYSEAVIPDSARSIGTSPIGVWTNATWSPDNARAAVQAVKIDYTANGTTNAELTSFTEDLSLFTADSTVVVGFYATSNLSSVRIRLGTDADNYFEFVLGEVTLDNYNLFRLIRSAATVVGTPNWSDIRYLAVRPSGTAGGAGSIYFDGIRFEGGVVNTSLLVARTVLSTPATIDTSVVSDIEYSLEVNFT